MSSLIDYQQIKQFLGLTKATVPSASKIETIRQNQFGQAPIHHVRPMPSAQQIAGIQGDVDNLKAQIAQGASLFFRKKGQGLTAKVGAVSFDLIISEEHSLEANICSHPVQNGDPITDHIQPQLPRGRVTVLVTNYSIKYGAGGPPSTANAWDASTSRAHEAWQVFKGIFQQRQLVTLVTVLETYTDVALSHVSAPRDSGTGDCLIFDVQFQQIKQVQLRTTQLPASCKPVDMSTADNRQASPKKSAGRVTPDVVPMVPSAGVAQ